MRFTVHGTKGSFLPDRQKVRGGADFSFEISGLKGEEIELGKPFTLVPVRVIPTAQIYRMELEGGGFIDALEVYPGKMIPIGRGSKIDERGEPIYDESYVGKSFEEITVGGGVSRKDASEEIAELLEDEEAKEEFLDVLSDAGITEEDLQKAAEGEVEAVDKVMKAVAENLTPRDVKSFFSRKFAKELIKDKEVVYNPAETLTEKDFKEKGKKYQLNAVIVGVDDEGEIRVVYAPDRLKVNSATAVAKAVNSSRPEYSAVLFVSGIRENQFTQKGKEYILKRLERYKEQLERIENADPEALEIVETAMDVVKSGDKKALPALIDAANRKKREYIFEQEILKDTLLVKSSEEKGYFLRTNIGAVGYPLMDYTNSASFFVAEVPRPIKVEGQWRVQNSVKLLGSVDKDGTVREIKSDAYTMAFDYPIYKVLSKLYTGKMDKDTLLTFSQVRALAGDGLGDNFLGLGALEKKFGKFKGAGAVYTELIRYVKDKIGKVLYKSDEEIKAMGEERAVWEVSKLLQEDKFISDYVNAMRKYLRMRAHFKPVEINIPQEKKKELFQKLREEGAILKSKNSGLFYLSKRPEYRQKGVEIIKKELNVEDDREAFKILLNIVKNANFYKLTKKTRHELFAEDGKYRKQCYEAKALAFTIDEAVNFKCYSPEFKSVITLDGEEKTAEKEVKAEVKAEAEVKAKPETVSEEAEKPEAKAEVKTEVEAKVEAKETVEKAEPKAEAVEVGKPESDVKKEKEDIINSIDEDIIDIDADEEVEQYMQVIAKSEITVDKDAFKDMPTK